MELRQIEFFIAIVEMGSFSHAAAELYVSQSSLSKQIISLEKELEVKLFDRSKRKIALTEVGKILYKHAVNLRNIHQSLLVDLDEYKKATPSLKIAAIPVTAQYGITSHISQFKKAYPQINFTLEERQSSTVLPALSQHKYDLAFMRDYNIDEEVFSSFPIVTDRLMVAVSCDHRFAERKSISLVEHSNENFIMFNQGTLINELSMNACRSVGFEPRVFYTASRAASIIGMVTSNSGVALMMEKVLNYYSRSKVVAIPLEQTFESKIIITYPKDKKPTKPAKTFLEFIKKKVSQ